jgi:biopolymer transport protein ExbD
MSFGGADKDDDVMSEINMTPLVDVMLVLLIIFIITIPVINHAVKLDLPRAASQPNDVKPPHIEVMIDAQGVITWNGKPVDRQALKEQIGLAAVQAPQPELHLRADRKTPYEDVAQLMAAAQSGGLNKIGFVTDPNEAK